MELRFEKETGGSLFFQLVHNFIGYFPLAREDVLSASPMRQGTCPYRNHAWLVAHWHLVCESSWSGGLSFGVFSPEQGLMFPFPAISATVLMEDHVAFHI